MSFIHYIALFKSITNQVSTAVDHIVETALSSAVADCY